VGQKVDIFVGRTMRSFTERTTV